MLPRINMSFNFHPEISQEMKTRMSLRSGKNPPFAAALRDGTSTPLKARRVSVKALRASACDDFPAARGRALRGGGGLFLRSADLVTPFENRKSLFGNRRSRPRTIGE